MYSILYCLFHCKQSTSAESDSDLDVTYSEDHSRKKADSEDFIPDSDEDSDMSSAGRVQIPETSGISAYEEIRQKNVNDRLKFLASLDIMDVRENLLDLCNKKSKANKPKKEKVVRYVIFNSFQPMPL